MIFKKDKPKNTIKGQLIGKDEGFLYSGVL